MLKLDRNIDWALATKKQDTEKTKVYIILSLTSKSVLAWIIFAGTLAPV
jgi:hypothetical protein